ncbi:MAG: restriction endonuclease subunit S [Pseudomonas sp.]|nr:restriction endonuclease subunit S [Pseudomonas sp.]
MSNPIPEGWSMLEMSEIITQFQNGNAFSAKGYAPEGIPIVSMGSIQLDGIFKKDNKKIKYWNSADREKLLRYIVKPQDLIMAMTDVTPTMELIGRACIVNADREYLLNQRVGLIKVDEERVSKYFLAYLSNYDDWRSYCMGASGLGAQANLGTAQILDGIVLLPPLPEQQKIATILSSVDDVIEKTRAQIDKLKDLKTGMMQELLTKGIGHTEFKDSPVGRIPAAWDVVPVSDYVIEKRSGASLSPADFSDEGFGVIPKKAIQFGGKLIWGEKSYCTNYYAASVPKSWVNKNFMITVLRDLVPAGPSIGLIVEIEQNGDFLIAQGVYGFRLNDGLHGGYLAQLSNSDWYRKEMRKILVGSTQVHIRSSEFFDVLIPKPALSEQVKINNALSAIDKKVIVMKEKMAALKSVKSALMQDLLTGKVRVKLTDKESAVV